MTSFEPKVSIVIPVYNGANYLSAAIESALAQTYSNFEVIVVNDGSRDDGATERIAQSFGDQIQYILKPNGGVASALNAGIEAARGEYISWLSHDDLYVPEKLKAQIEVLASQENREKTILYSDYGLFTRSIQDSEVVCLPTVPTEEFRYWLTISSVLHGCTLLVPKCIFNQAGRFDPRLKHTQDYSLWFQFASVARFVHVPKVLVHGRQHPEQDSKKKPKEAFEECNALYIRCLHQLREDELFRGTGLPLASAYAKTAVAQLRRGYGLAAWDALKLSVKHWPTISYREFKYMVKAILRLLGDRIGIRLFQVKK